MWLLAAFDQVALFTLKSGLATATGGKSLLVPTPFAIRTALLDVAIRVDGVTAGPIAFEQLQELDIAVRVPAHAVVTNLFAKILKPVRSDKDRDEAMTPTIAFREYVYWNGALTLAFAGTGNVLKQIAAWLPHINYLGRRGGFLQLRPPLINLEEEDALPQGYVSLTSSIVDEAGTLETDKFPIGTLQIIDDWGPGLTYEKVDVYSGESIKRPGTADERIRYGIIIPYQLRQSGRGFTLYERADRP